MDAYKIQGKKRTKMNKVMSEVEFGPDDYQFASASSGPKAHSPEIITSSDKKEVTSLYTLLCRFVGVAKEGCDNEMPFSMCCGSCEVMLCECCIGSQPWSVSGLNCSTPDKSGGIC